LSVEYEKVYEAKSRLLNAVMGDVNEDLIYVKLEHGLFRIEDKSTKLWIYKYDKK
jgi:hypothetical protein